MDSILFKEYNFLLENIMELGGGWIWLMAATIFLLIVVALGVALSVLWYCCYCRKRASESPSGIDAPDSVAVLIQRSALTRKEACDAAKLARKQGRVGSLQMQQLLDDVVNAVFDPSARAPGERTDVDLDLHMFRK